MIILASASPRRKELIRLITEDFKIIPSNADENISGEYSPQELTKQLSKIKAIDVFNKVKNNSDIIVSADTVVSIDNKVLGKPKDENDAFQTLKLLSGNVHSVYTGVTIMKGDYIDIFSEKTDVYFYPLTDDDIKEYLKNNEYKDKAGAYGIQGFGGLFVEKIVGDYNNVVGLPVSKLNIKLKSLGLNTD